MYLVAKSNAEAIQQSTKESSELAFYEINRTMSVLEEMQSKLFGIKSEISEASERYTKDLESITESFDSAKRTIENITEKVNEVTTNK